MDEKLIKKGHTMRMTDRASCQLTGIKDVIALDESEALLDTEMGVLSIRGKGLHMSRLTLEKGEADMEIDVRHIAKLAKLEIPEQEIPKMEQELSSIVSMVEKLPELVSKDSLLDPENTMELRPDVVQPSFARDEMLKNAPDTAAGCLMVPKVVE